jgi:hypothetical protein
MLSKTSVPVRPPTVQLQVAFPRTFWEPSGWVRMWSCSVKLPVIEPLTRPAGKKRVKNVLPSAVRKSDCIGAATKLNVPATETGVDAATGWSSRESLPRTWPPGWVPARARQALADGSAYAYTTYNSQTSLFTAFVVDVASGNSRSFKVPAAPWDPYVADFGPAGVYIASGSALGGPGGGVWLLDPVTGTINS